MTSQPDESDALQKKAEDFWKEIKDIEIPDVTTGKTTDEIIEDILEHEKAATGIDWKAAAAGGPKELKVAVDKAHAHLKTLKSKFTQDEIKKATQMGILQADGEIYPVLAMSTEEDPGAAPIPASAAPFVVWGWKPETAKKFQNAEGAKIKDLIVNLIRTFQVMKESESKTYMAKTFMDMGLVGLGLAGIAKVFQILKTLRVITRATEIFAIFEGIVEVGFAVIQLMFAVVILAVLVPLFVLMTKEASGMMVIINDSSQDQVLEEIECTHGKIVAIFKDNPTLENPQPILPKRTPPIINPETHKVVAKGSIQAGFFTATKKQLALIGTQGALKFKATASFPQGSFIGWSVPLSIGKNSLLVSANFDKSVSKFSDKTESDGKQEDTSKSTANATISGRVNSGSGSEAYYVMNFQSQ